MSTFAGIAGPVAIWDAKPVSTFAGYAGPVAIPDAKPVSTFAGIALTAINRDCAFCPAEQGATFAPKGVSVL